MPWHPDTDVFARRALAPARVSKVISDTERQVITAIVDEDQLSLAIGRNGQNVRLASQLIGWQIDLYGSREWVDKGADMSVLANTQEEEYETSDFPLAELDLQSSILGALSGAGYDTFLQIIDLDRRDFLGIEGLGEQDADRLLELIEALTVVENEASNGGEEGAQDKHPEEVQAKTNTAVEEAGELALDSEDSDEEEAPGA